MPAARADGEGITAVRYERKLLHGLEPIAQGDDILESEEPLPVNGRPQIDFRHIIGQIKLRRHDFRTRVAMRSDLITAQIFDQRRLWKRRDGRELIGRKTKTPAEIWR